jgi:hypothetical protein
VAARVSRVVEDAVKQVNGLVGSQRAIVFTQKPYRRAAEQRETTSPRAVQQGFPTPSGAFSGWVVSGIPGDYFEVGEGEHLKVLFVGSDVLLCSM